MRSTNVLIAAAAWTITGTSCMADNRWSNVGPDSGNVTRLAADPHNSAIIYAATCAGVYKTVNGGESWTSTAVGPPAECLTVLAVDPRNNETVYTGWCGGLFKTTDGGAIWSPLPPVPSPNCGEVLLIDPGNPETVYVSNYNGAFKSVNGGVNWDQISDHAVVKLLAIDPTGTLYATGSSGLVKSTDGGVNWNLANAGLPRSASGISLGMEALAIDAKDFDTLYAGRGGRMFKSTDGGASWSESYAGLSPALSAGYELLSLTTHARTPGVIYAVIVQHVVNDPSFVLMSTDYGANWTILIDTGIRGVDLNAIMLDPQDPAAVYVATSAGVAKSTDGASHWRFINAGLKASWIVHLFIDARDHTFVATNGTQAALASKWTPLYRSSDQGKTWTPAGFGLSPYGGLIADPQNVHVLYSSGVNSDASGRTTGSALFKSEDAGDTWSEIWTAPSSGVLSPIVIDPQNPNVLYAGRGICNGSCSISISKSLDGGLTWTDNLGPFKPQDYISSLAIDPQNQDVIYAGTAADDFIGIGLAGSGVWRSTDAGMTWTNLGIGGNIGGITIDPRDSATLYVAQDSLYKSTDGGQTCTDISPSAVQCCRLGAPIIDPHDSSILFAAGFDSGQWHGRVFRSADAGASWTVLSADLPGAVTSLTIDSQVPGRLYAATTGGLFAIILNGPEQMSAGASSRQ